MKNIPSPSLSGEHRGWLTQLADSREQVLVRAMAGNLDSALLRQVADTEALLALSLLPMPEDGAEHVRAAHTYARPYLTRFLQQNPALAVSAPSADYDFTPRKVLRYILDHALDHLKQMEQWLIWQQLGLAPTQTKGWGGATTASGDDRQPLTPDALGAWLWRIDLVVEAIAQRAEQLSLEQLDWLPPDGGWSLRRMLHHLASGEIYFATLLDAPLPEETVARYAEASQRLGQRLAQTLVSPGNEQMTFFGSEDTSVTIEQIVQEALAAEYALLNG